MLAHKANGEHPASYYNLLLVTQKLKRQAKARDPLLPKVAATNGSTMTCSQMPRNLFPSCKLKGTFSFAVHTATVGNDKAEEDPVWN